MLPEEIEEEYVSKVYDGISKHFDHTRYKPWSGIKSFVESLAPYSMMLDVGCGNGRNLCIKKDVIDFGTDNSMTLCNYAKQRDRPIFRATALDLPIRDGVFDAVICIAVIHHFASVERRKKCLQEISRLLKVGGKAYVTAWATEQTRKRYDEQDQLIRWNVHPQYNKEAPKFKRFYHLFIKGEFMELLSDIHELEIVDEKWIEGNWEIELKKIKLPK